ncbi:UNVERIFIED_CONTAM: class I SAM-dependent methyltransferase [Microbacterium sp. SLM126]
MHAAEFYTGIVPQVYVALRGTHFGTDRYRAFVAQHRAPALELGCGDDGPFFDLVSEGFDIEGVDSSADMVRGGRARLQSRGLTAAIHHQRMEDLDLDRQFGAIYLAGPTFNLLPDDLIAASALRAIARHLLPEGAALMPLWTPQPTPPEQFGVVRTADIGDVVARYVIESEDYDVAEHTRTSSVRYELGSGADAIVEHRDWIIHWYKDDRLRQLAADAGLSISLTVIDAEQVEATLQRLR